MRLRTLFALDAVVSVLLALGFLLGPATMLKFLGLTQGKTEMLLAQILGAALIGFAALAWFGRQAVDVQGPQGLQGTLAALISFSAIAFVVTLLGVMAQVTRAGGAWVLVALFLLAAGGYAYFQFSTPRE